MNLRTEEFRNRIADLEDEVGELRERAEKAEAEVERLTWALREIALGRTSVDNDGPLDPFTSMAGRFLSIAQDALRPTAARPPPEKT